MVVDTIIMMLQISMKNYVNCNLNRLGERGNKKLFVYLILLCNFYIYALFKVSYCARFTLK